MGYSGHQCPVVPSGGAVGHVRSSHNELSSISTNHLMASDGGLPYPQFIFSVDDGPGSSGARLLSVDTTLEFLTMRLTTTSSLKFNLILVPEERDVKMIAMSQFGIEISSLCCGRNILVLPRSGMFVQINALCFYRSMS